MPPSPRAIKQPPVPLHSPTLSARAEAHAQLLAAAMGADAVEVRALFRHGRDVILAEVAAGATEADVQRLKRIPRPETPT